MNRIFASIAASLLLLLNLAFGSVVLAQPLFAVTDTSAIQQTRKDPVEELKSKIIPEIESILTPEQNGQLEAAIIEGKQSLRKAFKSLSLTPDQKTKLATIFKTLPSKEIFTTMTPAEKKSFFLKKKSMFMPTPEEIGEKISAKMKLAKDKSSFAPSAEAITEKIGQKMEQVKERFLP
jgi:hypothetical protein